MSSFDLAVQYREMQLVSKEHNIKKHGILICGVA